MCSEWHKKDISVWLSEASPIETWWERCRFCFALFFSESWKRFRPQAGKWKCDGGWKLFNTYAPPKLGTVHRRWHSTQDLEYKNKTISATQQTPTRNNGEWREWQRNTKKTPLAAIGVVGTAAAALHVLFLRSHDSDGTMTSSFLTGKCCFHQFSQSGTRFQKTL